MTQEKAIKSIEQSLKFMAIFVFFIMVGNCRSSTVKSDGLTKCIECSKIVNPIELKVK